MNLTPNEIIALQIITPFIGAGLYRWRGSDLWKPPRPVLQALVALPLGYTVATHIEYIWLVPIIYALTVGALCLGHAKWQDMGTVKGTYWGDFFGMAWSGFLVTLPAGIALLNPVLAFSGAGKAVAYALSWKIVKGTWLGECLTGFLFWSLWGLP